MTQPLALKVRKRVSVIISKLSDQNNLQQESNIDFKNFPWLESRPGMP
jgi:hypothetical protein